MAPKNASIRNYFKSSSSQPEAPVHANREKTGPVPHNLLPPGLADEDPAEESLDESGSGVGEPYPEEPDASKASLTPRLPVIQSSRHCIVNGSDEEDSKSDSSLEDIYVALQNQSQRKPLGPATNGFQSPEKLHAQNKRPRTHSQQSPLKPKYKYDMKELIEQAERHKAIEASVLSMNALSEAIDNDSQHNSREDARDSILQSVIAEKEEDGVGPGKFLMAVKRTEATRSEKGWYFFDLGRVTSSTSRPFPGQVAVNGWKAMLADPQTRVQVLLSGFARDMVVLEGTIDNELLRWMLDEICLEDRSDLREAYCQTLAAVETQTALYMSCQVIRSLFEKLGAKKAALDGLELKLVSKDSSPYEGHDWTASIAVIAFLGRISKHLTQHASTEAMGLLTKLCLDSVVIDDLSLLAAVQKTIEQISSNVKDELWGPVCIATCSSLFSHVKLPALQLQVLRCIPQTTRRVHELRRRLGLAFFFQDYDYITRESHISLDLNDVIEQLKKPRFTINKETDYPELAALMTILNIAVDDGLSVKHDVTSPEGQRDFNKVVDALAARLKQMWGSINDAGAAFMSRSYAKEMVDGLRMRLEHTIRTKPKPKLSIFDTEEPDEDKVVLKQTTLSKKLFQKKPVDENKS